MVFVRCFQSRHRRFSLLGRRRLFCTARSEHLSSVLGQSFSIKSLTFNASVTGGSPSPAEAAERTCSPSVPAASRTMVSATKSLSAPVHLGASQSWTNNTANGLTVSGVISDTTAMPTRSKSPGRETSLSAVPTPIRARRRSTRDRSPSRTLVLSPAQISLLAPAPLSRLITSAGQVRTPTFDLDLLQ